MADLGLGSNLGLLEERNRPMPEAKPTAGAIKSSELTEGNWESKLWKRWSRGGGVGLNSLRTVGSLRRRRFHARRCRHGGMPWRWRDDGGSKNTACPDARVIAAAAVISGGDGGGGGECA